MFFLIVIMGIGSFNLGLRIVIIIICFGAIFASLQGENYQKQNYQKLKSYCDNNYTFVYKKNQLSEKTAKKIIHKIAYEYGYETEIDKKNHMVYIYQIQSGRDDFELLQKMYQKGYRVMKDKEEISSDTEIKKLLSEIEYDDDYVVDVNDQTKIVTVISP